MFTYVLYHPFHTCMADTAWLTAIECPFHTCMTGTAWLTTIDWVSITCQINAFLEDRCHFICKIRESCFLLLLLLCVLTLVGGLCFIKKIWKNILLFFVSDCIFVRFSSFCLLISAKMLICLYCKIRKPLLLLWLLSAC